MTTTVVVNGEKRTFVNGYVEVPPNWDSKVTIDGNVYTYMVKTSRNNVSFVYIVLLGLTLFLSGTFYLKRGYEDGDAIIVLFAATLLFFIPALLITSGFMSDAFFGHCLPEQGIMYFSGPYGLFINSYDVTTYQMGNGVQERYTFYTVFAKTITPYTVINGNVFYGYYTWAGQVSCAGCRTGHDYLVANSIPRKITISGDVFMLYNGNKPPKNMVCPFTARVFFLSIFVGIIIVSLLFYAFS